MHSGPLHIKYVSSQYMIINLLKQLECIIPSQIGSVEAATWYLYIRWLQSKYI